MSEKPLTRADIEAAKQQLDDPIVPYEGSERNLGYQIAEEIIKAERQEREKEISAEHDKDSPIAPPA